jgi:hypothetical protein
MLPRNPYQTGDIKGTTSKGASHIKRGHARHTFEP